MNNKKIITLFNNNFNKKKKIICNFNFNNNTFLFDNINLLKDNIWFEISNHKIKNLKHSNLFFFKNFENFYLFYDKYNITIDFLFLFDISFDNKKINNLFKLQWIKIIYIFLSYSSINDVFKNKNCNLFLENFRYCFLYFNGIKFIFNINKVFTIFYDNDIL